jgi:hypothetical protein
MQLNTYQAETDGISLKSITYFLKRNVSTFIVGGLAGIIVATAFVLLVPKRYESKMQLRMAQLGNGSIEDPTAFSQRLRALTVYPGNVLQACEKFDEEELGGYLDGVVEVATVKNVPNIVEMKVRGSSPEQVKNCSESIMQMIVEQQSDLIREKLIGHKTQIAMYLQTLRDENRNLENIKRPDIGGIAYLSVLGKISWLRSRIDTLQEEEMLSQVHPTKLTVPIFISQRQTFPRVRLTLLIGILIGLSAGALVAFNRRNK